MISSRPLENARIMVARAAGRGESLCARIRDAGGDALSVAVIDIHPLDDVHPPAGTPDWLIFTSVPAVEHGLPVLGLRGHARIAAIGNATADALRMHGAEPDIVPEREESEGLLATPAFQDLAGKKTWIVKGRGGRELLADALRERGATTSTVDVYERRLPDAAALLERWNARRIDAVVVSSRAALENLHAMLNAEGRRQLRETQLVMPTERMLKLALELGIRPAPVIAAGASDDALLAALLAWWRDRLQDFR